MKAILTTIVLFAICGLLQAQVNDTLNSRLQQDSIVVLDVFPSFPGGEAALMLFLRDNVKYPQLAKESGIQGTVFVSFVIEVDGTLTNINVLRGIGGGCDEEVVRMVQTMPHWNPAESNGNRVRSQFNLPIRFILDGPTNKPNKKKKKK